MNYVAPAIRRATPMLHAKGLVTDYVYNIVRDVLWLNEGLLRIHDLHQVTLAEVERVS